MANTTRVHRVETLLQRVLAECLRREIKDPRLHLATLSGVHISKDLSLAKVYISLLSEGDAAKEAMKALEKAKGFLRHKIAQECELRIVPELQFVHDTTAEQSQHISMLIAKGLHASQ